MTTIEQEVQTLHIAKSETIVAPPDVVWEAVLHQMGPGTQGQSGGPMNMKLEPFPGGRWYRDLGDDAGHLWAHVQVIKPNKLLELCGPMFMSFAAASHIQYRLTPDGATTRLDLTHTAIGLIPAEHRAGMDDGWRDEMRKIRERAERTTR